MWPWWVSVLDNNNNNKIKKSNNINMWKNNNNNKLLIMMMALFIYRSKDQSGKYCWSHYKQHKLFIAFI